jgi:hypothetical protein
MRAGLRLRAQGGRRKAEETSQTRVKRFQKVTAAA